MTAYSLLRILALLGGLVVFSGCAHNIQINPDLSNVRNMETASALNKNVAYYISAEDRIKLVTTPGGGGDKVSYKPYADSEGALNTILSNVFARVYSISDLNDAGFLREKEISFIFLPSISTNSSSESLMTWPPTDFTFTLTCTAIDAEGNEFWDRTVEAKGHADYKEFKSDFGLAARRAVELAFRTLLSEIDKSEEFK